MGLCGAGRRVWTELNWRREDCRLCLFSCVRPSIFLLPPADPRVLFQPTTGRGAPCLRWSLIARPDQTRHTCNVWRRKKKEYAPEILKILHDAPTTKTTTTNAHVYSFFLVVLVLLLVGNLPSLDDDWRCCRLRQPTNQLEKGKELRRMEIARKLCYHCIGALSLPSGLCVLFSVWYALNNSSPERIFTWRSLNLKEMEWSVFLSIRIAI